MDYHHSKIPLPVLFELARYMAIFDLSYGQLCRYLWNKHNIKYTPQGMRKIMLSFLIDNPGAHNI